MAIKKVEGKMLLMGIGDKFFDCQTSVTINIVQNTSENEVCKPTNGDVASADWVEYTVNSKGWDTSMTATVFNEIVTSADSANNFDLVNELLTGEGRVQVVFRTNSSLGAGYILSGEAIITNYSETGDVEGNANYDVQFQGTGPLVETIVPAPAP